VVVERVELGRTIMEEDGKKISKLKHVTLGTKAN
jgi:hypothetical protein